MRKTICTASLFFAAIAMAASSFLIRLPDYLFNYRFGHDDTLALPIWAVIYVTIPVAMLALAVSAAHALWRVCSALCSKLRGRQ